MFFFMFPQDIVLSNVVPLGANEVLKGAERLLVLVDGRLLSLVGVG